MPRLRLVALVALTAVALAGDASAFGVVLEPLPVGATGQLYDYQFRVNGGNPPYTFTVKPDVLPPGLSLSPSGRLTGFPLVSGSWRFYVEGSYTWETSPPRFSQRQFTLDVVVGLSILSRSLPVAIRSAAYRTRLVAAGGGKQTWSISRGALPPGLSLTSGGLVSGYPIRAGIFTFTAMVTDDPRANAKRLSLQVVPAPAVTVAPLPPAVVGSPFSARVRGVGGLPPYAWSLRDGVRPPGITISSGTLHGTPTAAGRYVVDVVARDAVGNIASSRVHIVVMPRLRIPAQALVTGHAERPYRARVVTRGGAAPLTFRVADGELPAGMTLHARTGVLAGNPRDGGRYTFTIAVADRVGGTHRRSFVLSVR